jgi:hypothetical protein
MKKMVNLGILGVSPSISNEVPGPYLDPQSKSLGDPYQQIKVNMESFVF